MSRIGPLPVRTRVFRGETLDSYARRHASKNRTTVRDIETDLKANGLLPSSTNRRHPRRLAAWRALGDLSPTAFSEPETVLEFPVAIRRLCAHCTRGEQAYGRRPDQGMVCRNHQQWLGETQIKFAISSTQVVAEKRFVKNLATKNVLFDAPVMQIARSAAFAAIPESTIAERAASHGISDHQALLYPEQVGIACVLCEPDIMESATDPSRQVSTRRGFVESALAPVFDGIPNARLWAAILAIQPALDRTIKYRRQPPSSVRVALHR